MKGINASAWFYGQSFHASTLQASEPLATLPENPTPPGAQTHPELIHCDNCEALCTEGHGDRDKAVFCCNCAMRHAPLVFHWLPCDRCAETTKALERSRLNDYWQEV